DVYVQADWAPAERWRINIGARHSRVEFESDDRFVTGVNPDDSGRLEYSRTSPVAGVLFRATPALSLYANAGAGFETPTFAELAYRSDGLSGLNDTLAPARSRNYELGLRGRTGALDYSAAVFHSRTEDELVVAASQGGRSIYANAETSRRQGLELAVSGELAPDWSFATAYTFLDAEYVDDFSTAGDLVIEGGRDIPGLARHFAWGQLRWSPVDRKSTRLNSSHVKISYAVFLDLHSSPTRRSSDLADRAWNWRCRVSSLRTGASPRPTPSSTPSTWTTSRPPATWSSRVAATSRAWPGISRGASCAGAR